MKGVSKYGRFRLKNSQAAGSTQQPSYVAGGKKPGSMLISRPPLAELSRNIGVLESRAGKSDAARSTKTSIVVATETKSDAEGKVELDTRADAQGTVHDDSDIDHLILPDDDKCEEESCSGESDAPSEYMTAKSNPALHMEVAIAHNDLYTEYDNDVYRYLRHRELLPEGRPRLNRMRRQSEVNMEMRAVLVDWFVDVCNEYDLCQATFFLAVSLVDRTLSYVDCPRNKLQLLGASALFLAAKMEDVYPPQLTEVVFITDETYDADQIRRMEKVILRCTNFDLVYPTVDAFAHMFMLHRPISSKTQCLMWFLLELSALHSECLRFRPSHLAAAAFAISIHATKSETIQAGENKPSPIGNQSSRECPWTGTLEERSSIRRDELREPASLLCRLHQQAAIDSFHAVHNKYSDRNHHRVAEMHIAADAIHDLLV